jgi:hypothetical protein
MRNRWTKWVIGLGVTILMGLGVGASLLAESGTQDDAGWEYRPLELASHMTDDRLRQLFIQNEEVGTGSRAFAHVVLFDTAEKMEQDADRLDWDLMQVELRSRLITLRRIVPGIPEHMTRDRLGQLIVQHGFASIHDPTFQQVVKGDSPDAALAGRISLDSDLAVLESRLAEKRQAQQGG